MLDKVNAMLKFLRQCRFIITSENGFDLSLYANRFQRYVNAFLHNDPATGLLQIYMMQPRNFSMCPSLPTLSEW